MLKWFAYIATAIGGIIVLSGLFYPSVTLRYRLTLEVEVEGQRRTGSSVSEVTYGKQSQFAAQRPLRIGYCGEAVVLDLGQRGKLFALLTADNDHLKPEWIIPFAFGLSGRLTDPVEEGIQRLKQLSGSRELPLTNLPVLARFRNINDPTSVERVNPRNLGSSFGAGVALRRVSIEIVSRGIWPLSQIGIAGAPLTSSIRSELPWLANYRNKMLDGERFSRLDVGAPFSSSLTSISFVHEC